MEVKITIDCTPEEARRFFGLPDVSALNDAMIEKMKTQMEETMDAQAASELMKSWLSGTSSMQNNFTNLQNMFFSVMAGNGANKE